MVDVGKRLRRLALWAAGALLLGVRAGAGWLRARAAALHALGGRPARRAQPTKARRAARRRPARCSPPSGAPATGCAGRIPPRDRRADRHRRPPLLGASRRRLAAAFSSLAQTLSGDTQGGSTLTQQLAQYLPGGDRPRAQCPACKLKGDDHRAEDRAALQQAGDSRAYLNTVSFHYNAFGIGWRAPISTSPPPGLRRWPGAALIPGLLKGTRVWNSQVLRPSAREASAVVLAQMLQHGKLEGRA